MARHAGRKGMRSRGKPRSKRQGGGGTGSITTKAELGIQVVDFFDYTYAAGGSIKHYFWDCNQNLFNNNPIGTSGQPNSFCRVRKLEVYALPRKGFNLDQLALNSNAAAMFTTNVQTPAMTYATASGAPTSVALATNTQVTNVLPQVDTMWKKVYSCDMQKTFQSGVIRPYYVKDQQCLFSLRLVDPETGTDLDGTGSETVKIKIKVVLHLDQPIMPIQRAQRALISNNNVGSPGTDPAGNPPVPLDKYMQMNLTGVLNKFS